MSSVVLISALQQSDSVMHVYAFFFNICSIMVYPCTLTYKLPVGAVQEDIVYPFCT